MVELDQAEGCPYCVNIRSTLTELGLSYIIHNPRTARGDNRDEQPYEDLMSIGGKDQIPFLVDRDRGESPYGSDEIVDYLEQQYGRKNVAQ